MLATLLIAQLASARPIEDVGALEQRIEREVGAAVGAPGGPRVPLDRRLRLAACPVPAQLSARVPGMIEVHCPLAGWRFHVALATGGETAASLPVVRRGDPVAVRVAGDGFALTVRGRAERDARAGERIRISMGSGRAPIIAEITGPGRAAAVD